ncbi:MAG: class I SAM-dependent methyltransferase [Pseudomonadota bacterium]
MTLDHTSINRDHWNRQARDWIAAGEEAWASDEPYWGIWEYPETEVALLPDDMTGQRAIELGCGTAYVSAWMARRGAEVTGIDISTEQLATARRLAARHQTPITLLEGNAEATGLRDNAFDFAISEYGAAIWCDPRVWLVEAHRLLRPGGALVFLGHHPFVTLTTPMDGAACENVLHRPYRGMHVENWTEVAIEPGGIEFNLTWSGWMHLFARIGFSVTGYQELFAPENATETHFGIPADWSRDYPAEQIWHLQKPT